MTRLHMNSLLIAIQVVIVLQLSSTFELPFLGSCTISDENCHKKHVEKFLEMYGNGIPELDIPTLDPMNLGNIVIDGSNNENFNLHIYMNNVKLYKYPVTKCLSVKGFTPDVSKPMKVTIKVLTPDLIMRTHCTLKGKLLIFNVAGDTDLEVVMKNVSTIMTAVSEPYIKDSRTYLRIKSFTPKLKIGSLKTFFKNSTLFGADPVFADTFAETINDNWRVLAEEIQPHLEEANTKISINILNKLLATMPYDRFFKKDEQVNMEN